MDYQKPDPLLWGRTNSKVWLCYRGLCGKRLCGNFWYHTLTWLLPIPCPSSYTALLFFFPYKSPYLISHLHPDLWLRSCFCMNVIWDTHSFFRSWKCPGYLQTAKDTKKTTSNNTMALCGSKSLLFFSRVKSIKRGSSPWVKPTTVMCRLQLCPCALPTRHKYLLSFLGFLIIYIMKD